MPVRTPSRPPRGKPQSPRTDRADFVTLRIDSARRAFSSDAGVARALGVDASQVTRWRLGQVPDPANADQLAGLDLVIELLDGYLSPGRIPKWLHGANANLGDRTPLGMLRMGRLPEVIAAVQVLKSGAHA